MYRKSHITAKFASIVAAAVISNAAIAVPNPSGVFFDFAELADFAKANNGAFTGNEAHWNVDLAALSGPAVGGTIGVGNSGALNGLTYFEKGGIRVHASATGNANGGNGPVDAYLDGWSGGPGGIGACSNDANDCGSQDNAASLFNEVVTLTFYDLTNSLLTVDLLNTYHTDGNHQAGFTDTIADLDISGTPFDLGALPTYQFTRYNSTNTGNTRETTLTGFTGSSFTFTPIRDEVYISGVVARSSVPEPSILALLGLGLLGLGVVRRKK